MSPYGIVYNKEFEMNNNEQNIKTDNKGKKIIEAKDSIPKVSKQAR